jgi:NAD(P)-dependent dehydrogenase (short-subunit alcohol dehydrogenase family)
MGSPRLAAAPSQDATDLSGNAVIISGGTTGIGRATARLLAAERRARLRLRPARGGCSADDQRRRR